MTDERPEDVGILHAPGCASAPHAEGEMVRGKCDCGERLIAEREAHATALTEHGAMAKALIEEREAHERTRARMPPDSPTYGPWVHGNALNAARAERDAAKAEADEFHDALAKERSEVERLRGERARMIAAGDELEAALDAGTLDGCDLCGGEYHEETCVIAKWRACLPPTAAKRGDHEGGER